MDLNSSDHVTTALLICGFSLKARNDGQSNDLMQQPLLARIDGRQVYLILAFYSGVDYTT
ncbi:hypothetical protein F5887DRAFT_1079033 [Amanita rubescens]|nr:hypothetical protein F5887DRAFT_1079033 [Amanita rubescens]